MAHLTTVIAPTDSASGVHAFLDQPAVSSVVTPLRTTTSEYDDVNNYVELRVLVYVRIRHPM